MAHKKSQKPTLSVEQENAIDMLVTGLSDAQVATKVGVARETVCRWRNDNPAFTVELNRRRQALWSTGLDKLRKLVPKAVEVLEAELDGDHKLQAAIHILKGVGLYGSNLSPSGLPTSEYEIELANMEQRSYLALRESFASS